MIIPAIGITTLSLKLRIMEKTPAFHAAGVVPTFAATSPTSLLIWSNIPSRLPIMQSRRMPLIQSVIMSRMFSISQTSLSRTDLPARG